MDQSSDSKALDDELEEVVLQSLGEPSERDEEIEVPDDLYVFPLLRRPFFPGMAAPIVIEPGPFYEILKKIAKSKQKFVGLFLAKDEEADVYGASAKDLYKTGVLARVLRIIPMEQGGAQVILNMECRVECVKEIPDANFLRCKIEQKKDIVKNTRELKAYAISIISTIKELLNLNPLFKEELQIFLGHSDFTEPGKLADFAVALTTATREELQDVLETYSVQKRIDKALILLKKELDLSLLQQTINSKIEATINQSQREFFLREQLKTIRRELGMEKDDRQCDREKFEARLENLVVPPDVMPVIEEELEKIAVLDPQSSEYAIARSYLDWLTVVPWGTYAEERHQLREAQKILEQDHYGLDEIKERILEIIGVGRLTNGVRGSIICLVGPPGVGKTSIGKSIARALNRPFYRFSVGGMRDEAEIKGHRRTYIGAMPGKMIQALKQCKAMNPVIMLDEVDKMGASYQGDPASALLEVLDPEQNKEFLDHYLDVRCDLSNTLFIVTANVLDDIPGPLRDRMEVMRLSGYIMEEKLEIARKYLIPQHRKEMGLLASQVSFTKDSLRSIINGYAREAGVRGLENQVKKILRKVATKVVRGHKTDPRGPRSKAKKAVSKTGGNRKTYCHKITAYNIVDFLGKPIFTSDRYYDRNPVGVVTGLAWTALGGATLYIEAIKVAGEKTMMKLTGQAGDVMKESSEIAWSYLHSNVHHFAPEYTFFEKCQVHIHIPEGATPKDGPSAGITMVTSLLSLLMDCPIIEDLGMTGEITLTGRVLPIGGVREKVVAARRSGLKTLIFPRENERDYEELPDFLKKGLTVYFVEHYSEVFRIAFPKRPLHVPEVEI